MKSIGFLFAFITLFFFSIDTVAMKHLITETEISAIGLSFLRYFLASMFLGAIYLLFFYKKDSSQVKKLISNEKILKNKMFWGVTLSLVISISLFHYGLGYTTASNSVLIETLSPVILILLLLYFLPHRLSSAIKTRKIFFIIIIASLGSSILLSESISQFQLSSDSDKLYGDVIEFLSMIFFATFLLFNGELRNKYKNYNPVFITFLIFGCASLLSLPFGFSSISTLMHLSYFDLSLLLLVSIGSTAIAYLSWFLAAKYISTLTLGLLINIIGVTTVIFEYYIYNDQSLLGPKIIIGGCIIIGVSIYIEWLNRKEIVD